MSEPERVKTPPPQPGLSRWSDLQARVVAGCFLLLVLGVVFVFESLLPFAVGAACVILFWEWQNITADKSFRLLTVLGFSGLVALFAAWYFLDLSLSGILAYCLAYFVFFAGVEFFTAKKRLWSAFGFFYIAFTCLSLIEWVGQPSWLLSNRSIFFLVLGCVILSDMCAYFSGRFFGRRKLAPRISPNKTWEGAFGALFGVTIFGLLSGYVNNRSWEGGVAVIFLLIFISVVAQCGDLLESGVKRRFGVKDSSRLIPGHGGLFDRLDGAVAVFFVIFVIEQTEELIRYFN